jgi:hypothetical protein
MMLTDLAHVLRAAGLTVVEVPGWRTRGHGELVRVDTIVCHHTATSAKAAGNYPSLAIVRDGRSDLPGPLCNLGLGRDGTVYVVAASLAYHAGTVRQTTYGNAYSIGIEAEHDGISPWPPALLAAYARLCAVLAEHYQLPTSRVLGHKEVCAPVGRKTDPNTDMDAFRAAVDNARDEDDVTPQQQEQLDRIESKLDKLDKVLARITKAKREVIHEVKEAGK